MCFTKIFRSAIFSVSLKFGACYITGRGYFRMKTATLWCLIDISTLINFSKLFELGHSYSFPPQVIRFLGFFQAPRLFQPLSIRRQKTLSFHILFRRFFQPVMDISVFSNLIPLSNFRNTTLTNMKKGSMIRNCQWSYL